MSTSQVLTPSEFLEDFLTKVKNARSSVYLQSMNFEAGEVLDRIEDALLQALSRGVRVNINHDWVARTFAGGDLSILPTLSKERRASKSELCQKSQATEDRLRSHGATIIITNKPNWLNKYLPMIRRNHMKLYIVDESVAYLGGVNLFDKAFKNIDIMLKFDDKSIVKKLARQFFMVNSLRSPVDYQLKLTPTESLFVDSGKLGSSIIYNEAVDRVEMAKSQILFMSQFVPDGPLLQRLIKATQRGVRVEVITSSKESSLFRRYPMKLTYLYFKYIISKHPGFTLIHKNAYVHAKILVVDEDYALVGSHNYTYAGVVFGTEEIMIETTEKMLVKKIKEFALA